MSKIQIAFRIFVSKARCKNFIYEAWSTKVAQATSF